MIRAFAEVSRGQRMKTLTSMRLICADIVLQCVIEDTNA
jgi:hypothetical protein